jgi:competence protein ComEC
MLDDLKQHSEMILGVGAFCLGVWVSSEGLVMSSFVLGGLFGVGIWKLEIGKLFWGVMGMLFMVGFFRFGMAYWGFEEVELQAFHDEEKTVEVEGVVVDYPDVRGDRIKLMVEVDRVGEEAVEGVALITVNRYPEYFYKERLGFKGQLKEPHNFEEFSYERYLRRYGIDSVMYNPRAWRVGEEPHQWWDWKRPVFDLKWEVENRLNRLLTEPYASFSAGLLLGSRRGIPEDIMEDFNTSGLTHIIAISGYNITLIIVFVSGLFQFLSKRWQTIVATVVIGVFVVLVGGTAAVVRSAIMGVLGLWAIWFGRRSEVTRLLAITAGGMTMWNPFILVDDVGFQLSFAATCGLVYMTDSVERFLKWLRVHDRIPEFLSIREAFVTTLAAQTLAVPIIIVSFGRLSLIAPVANVAAVSLIPIAMMLSFVSLLVSYFWWEGGLMIAYVAWFFLEAIVQIAHWSALVPFASVDVSI